MKMTENRSYAELCSNPDSSSPSLSIYQAIIIEIADSGVIRGFVLVASSSSSLSIP